MNFLLISSMQSSTCPLIGRFPFLGQAISWSINCSTTVAELFISKEAGVADT